MGAFFVKTHSNHNLNTADFATKTTLTMKMLVVDDWPDNVVLLQEYLELLGCEYDFAENGEKAVELVREQTYAAVFMDIEMPVMNGIEATQEIRTVLPAPANQTPVIAISAHHIDYLNERKTESGFTDFMPKPYTLVKLETLLKKHEII